MSGLRALVPSVALCALAACSPAGTAADPTGGAVVTPTAATTTSPAVLLIDRDALADARAAAVAGRADLAPAVTELRHAADAALAASPLAVTDKTIAAPSGDRHDYLSLSIYWWPDPAKADGLPYLQRDGQINPESSDVRRYDAPKLVRMVASVETLALAAYVTGERSYGDGAARWLRTWFLDETTRMKPSLRYAQIIPGRTEPRGTGIIDSRQLMRVVDAALLLDGTPSWPAADQAALRAWFGQLVDWLATSGQGQQEARAANNHGTWYDAQVVDFALFAGRANLARDTLAQVGARRATLQIAEDGRQPLELARTRSFHYSAFNLLAFAVLGDLGERAGVEVWRGSTDRLRAGIDLVLRYAGGAKVWPYPEQQGVDFGAEVAPILARASHAYPDAGYDRALAPLVAKQTALGALRLRLGLFGNLGGTAAASPSWSI